VERSPSGHRSLSGSELLEEDTLALTGFTHGAYFAERYRIDALLGSGAMGKVFRAVDTQTHGACAVKVLHPDKARKEQVLQRFRREADILGELNHPGIVRVLDSGRRRTDRKYLVMELLDKAARPRASADRWARRISSTVLRSPTRSAPRIRTSCTAILPMASYSTAP
jgi:serine/threonine protein kinase